MSNKFGAKIVVIGGGTGSFVVLSGLKNYASDITALVNMADDGGSTGVLRDELGVLPPGDVRQCLVALSQSPKVRDLFNYRFDEGSLSGHAFGNLFLAALEKMTGSFVEAVDLADEILNVQGKVLPITLDDATLCAKIGRRKIVGEFRIAHEIFSRKNLSNDSKNNGLVDKFREKNEPAAPLREQKNSEISPKIPPEFYLIKKSGRGKVRINPAAEKAILDADLVVVAPGNLYGSLAPTLLVAGVGDALKKSAARKIYISNLVTKPGQTDGFAVDDFAREIERLAGGNFLDFVIFNVHQPSKKLLENYAADGELPVKIDAAKLKNAHFRAKGAELLADEIWQNSNKKDPIAAKRTLIRHDPDAVARAIMKIYFS